MKTQDAKKALGHKIAPSRKMPEDKELSEMFFEAMLWIANKCVPSELVRIGEDEDRVYRNIESGHFICFPDKPNFANDKEHIMIDEPLTYAVINEVAFMISANPLHRQMANEIIGDFNANDGREREWND